MQSRIDRVFNDGSVFCLQEHFAGQIQSLLRPIGDDDLFSMAVYVAGLAQIFHQLLTQGQITLRRAIACWRIQRRLHNALADAMPMRIELNLVLRHCHRKWLVWQWGEFLLRQMLKVQIVCSVADCSG